MTLLESLKARFMLIAAIIVALAVVYIGAGYVFTHHIKDEAKNVNIAGRQRMLTVSTVSHFHLLLGPSPSDIEIHRKRIKEKEWKQ